MHDIGDPTNKLLIAIAIGGAPEHDIALGRQEKDEGSVGRLAQRTLQLPSR
jgi:hypothetical protein